MKTIKILGIILQNLYCGELSRYSSFSSNGNILIIRFNYENCFYFRKSKIEKRIAITPEIAKKYISLGFEVSLSENYGSI